MLLKGCCPESVNPYISSMCSQISRGTLPLYYTIVALWGFQLFVDDDFAAWVLPLGSNLNYDPGVCLTRIPRMLLTTSFLFYHYEIAN